MIIQYIIKYKEIHAQEGANFDSILMTEIQVDLMNSIPLKIRHLSKKETIDVGQIKR